MLKGHGADSYLFNDIIADFSSNVIYYNNNAGLMRYLTNSLTKIIDYPEPNAESLTVKLAVKHGLDTNHLLVTNGAVEAIYLIAQTFSNSKTAIVIPAFREYEDAASLFGHDLNYYPGDIDIPDFKEQLIFICNPNNPTGSYIDLKELSNTIESNQQSTFVIDESYIDFVDKGESIIGIVNNLCNVVVIRSFTKRYAIPGLRLGYIVSHPSLISKIEKFKQPWSVNTLAIEAGKFLLESTDSFDLRELLVQTNTFRQALDHIPFLEIKPTSTHFFLVELKKGTSRELKHFLVNECRILIRDASNFRGLNNRFIRLSTQNMFHNRLLINELISWSESIS